METESHNAERAELSEPPEGPETSAGNCDVSENKRSVRRWFKACQSSQRLRLYNTHYGFTAFLNVHFFLYEPQYDFVVQRFDQMMNNCVLVPFESW